MGNTLELNLKEETYAKIIKLISKAISNGSSVACWSLPQDVRIHLILSDNVRPLSEDFQIEHLNKGFLVAPFNNRDDETLFFESDFYWNSGSEYADSIENQNDPASSINYWGPGRPLNTVPEDYLTMVENIVKGIEHNMFEKVVPARAKTSPLSEDFDVFDFFLTLREQYPDAFISWFYIPEKGSWIGASPEILIELKDHKFKTVALAGTQPHDPSHAIRETTWTQKEIEEQALVSRYIINCFKKIRLREFEEHGPKTVRAGNLLHLKTDFEVDMKATNFHDIGTVMLKLLHPTSAVCGMPLESAKDFLHENEGFSRGYYAGYLGPVNVDGSTNLFVNLRCLQLIKGHAISYAGAGVTIDSEPLKELNETEIKMSTLIRWLK